MKLQLNESGIQNIRQIAKEFNKAKIYFHIDLDGVTSAIAAKYYLMSYGIKTIDCQRIQYGSQEWAIEKPDNGVLPILVDFSHGKPFMRIHTDHHSNQIAYQGSSRNFRHSKSNAETISSIISTKDIFSQEDIKIINMVDSAGYKEENISPSEMLQIMLNIDKSKDSWRNHIQMGMVTGKLLLTYKNKPDYLEKIVMESKPSLISMYLTMMKIIKEHITSGDKGWYGLEDIQKNSDRYRENQESKKIESGDISSIDSMKNGESLNINNTVIQIGGGQMSKAGMYDRYTVFRLYPEVKNFVMVWDSIGMIQVSKNPWDENQSDVHLGELIINGLIEKKYKRLLRGSKYRISLLALKMENEKDINDDNEKTAIGYTYDDLERDFPKVTEYMSDKQKYLIKKYMNWRASEFNSDNPEVQRALDMLSRYYVPLYNIVMLQSGGHPSITNITGFEYLKTQRRIYRKIKQGLNPYEKKTIEKDADKNKPEEQHIEERKLSDFDILIRNIAKDIVSLLTTGKVEKSKSTMSESISDTRKCERIVLEYMRNFDNRIFEDIPEQLNEGIYNALSKTYDEYDSKRHFKTKREFFSSLVKTLDNKNISSNLKSYIKNILI